MEKLIQCLKTCAGTQPRTCLFRIMDFCVYLLLFSYSSSKAADIVYQHNFNNLSDPPTSAELNTPNTINSQLTSAWIRPYTFQPSYISSGEDDKTLSLNIKEAKFILKIKVPVCKKLEITSISLKGVCERIRNFQITVNGVPFGEQFSLPRTLTGATVTANSTIAAGEVTIELISKTIYLHNLNLVSIDDFTINGTVSDDIVPLEKPVFSLYRDRCQSYEIANYHATAKGTYTSFQYSLDEASLAGGVKVNSTTGDVTYPFSHVNETTVTATATSCSNQPLSSSLKVITNPGGVPVSDEDYVLKIPNYSAGAECIGGKCEYIQKGCYQAGIISAKAFEAQTVTVRLRFAENVRNYEILGAPFTGLGDSPGVTLYYTQADFDNYKGSTRLPKGPDDTEGKANLRLSTFFDGESSVSEKLTPVVTWDDQQRRWVVRASYLDQLQSWSAKISTKIFLSDAGGGFPVKLESISAKSTPEGNRLTWKTSEEINFSHFEIEKSEDPREGFQYLATVSSAKISSGNTYHYTDIPSSSSMQYYRLKMMDFDGSFEHSKIVTAGGQLNDHRLLVYPNPAQNSIFLESPDAVKSVNLFDQKGNEVFSRSFLDEGNSLSIPLPKLNAGAYYLKVNSGTENQQIRKVVVQ